MVDDVLTLTEAALLVGIKKPSILEAVGRGRLKRRDDKMFDRLAVESFMRGRGHPHGPEPQVRTSRPNGPTNNFAFQHEAGPDAVSYGVPDRICDISVALIGSATTIAAILARHLPIGDVKSYISAMLAEDRAQWVGGPDCSFAPMCETNYWPAPPGYEFWWQHPMFTEGVYWEEVEGVAEAWRTEHGLPAL